MKLVHWLFWNFHFLTPRWILQLPQRSHRPECRQYESLPALSPVSPLFLLPQISGQRVENQGQRNEEILQSPHYLPQKGKSSRNRDLLFKVNRKGISICLRAKPMETGTISRTTYFTADSGIGGGRQKLNPEAHVQAVSHRLLTNKPHAPPAQIHDSLLQGNL